MKCETIFYSENFEYHIFLQNNIINTLYQRKIKNNRKIYLKKRSIKKYYSYKKKFKLDLMTAIIISII